MYSNVRRVCSNAKPSGMPWRNPGSGRATRRPLVLRGRSSRALRDGQMGVRDMVAGRRGRYRVGPGRASFERDPNECTVIVKTFNVQYSTYSTPRLSYNNGPANICNIHNQVLATSQTWSNERLSCHRVPSRVTSLCGNLESDFGLAAPRSYVISEPLGNERRSWQKNSNSNFQTAKVLQTSVVWKA